MCCVCFVVTTQQVDVLHAWININFDLNMNGPHQHGFGDMSAVIYFNNLTNDDYGAIHFRDPRQWSGNEQDLRVAPKAGDMVFFPSWMTHWVEPTYSKNNSRIAFAINANFKETSFDESKFKENNITQEMLDDVNNVYFRIKLV